jgi:hypothetical protein
MKAYFISLENKESRLKRSKEGKEEGMEDKRKERRKKESK